MPENRALEALFKSGVADPAAPTLFVRARYHPALDAFQRLDCHQTCRLQADHLPGICEPNPPYETCLYLGTQQRQENLWNFARCLNWLAPGGHFWCTMPNELGAARYEKELKKAGLAVVSHSLRKSRVFGCATAEAPAEWLAMGEPGRREHGFVSRPGVYGWDKIDKGSQLLVSCFPEVMEGEVADLGSGYGYLAAKVPGGRVHLYESERLALDCARENVPAAASFHWADVTRDLPSQAFDWVVTNPPFHQGKAESLETGLKFITEAARALRPGGRIMLVANQHLPYEKALDTFYVSWREVKRTNAYKILEARK